jgi:hypothetical protein
MPIAPWFGVRQRHVAAVQDTVPDRVPATHVYEPDKTYPVLHDGVHVVPLAMLAVHVPRAPFIGAETAHGLGVGASVGAHVLAARL